MRRTPAAFRAGITTLTRRNEATLRVAEARFALADLIYRERQLAISLDQLMFP